MDLVAVLQKMGAIISVDVDRTFRIEGVKELNGFTHTSLTDRIEAASSMISGSIAAPDSSVLPSASTAASSVCSVAPTDGYGRWIFAPCRPFGAVM